MRLQQILDELITSVSGARAAILADWGCDYLQGALVGLATTDRPWLTAPAAATA